MAPRVKKVNKNAQRVSDANVDNRPSRVSAGAKNLKIKGDLDKFEDWIGRPLAPNKRTTLGFAVEPKMLSTSERKEWKEFNNLASDIEAWYNEARKRATPRALDIVCCAISSQSAEKEVRIYGRGLNTPTTERKEKQGTKPRNDEAFRQARFDTFDGVRRNAIKFYLLSPHGASSDAAHRKAVLLSIQRSINEQYRRSLCNHGLDTVYWVNELSLHYPGQNIVEMVQDYLTVHKPNALYQPLNTNGVQQRRELIAGDYYHNTVNGMETTTNLDAWPASALIVRDIATQPVPKNPTADNLNAGSDIKIKDEPIDDDDFFDAPAQVPQNTKRTIEDPDDLGGPSSKKMRYTATPAGFRTTTPEPHQGRATPQPDLLSPEGDETRMPVRRHGTPSGGQKQRDGTLPADITTTSSEPLQGRATPQPDLLSPKGDATRMSVRGHDTPSGGQKPGEGTLPTVITTPAATVDSGSAAPGAGLQGDSDTPSGGQKPGDGTPPADITTPAATVYSGSAAPGAGLQGDSDTPFSASDGDIITSASIPNINIEATETEVGALAGDESAAVRGELAPAQDANVGLAAPERAEADAGMGGIETIVAPAGDEVAAGRGELAPAHDANVDLAAPERAEADAGMGGTEANRGSAREVATPATESHAPAVTNNGVTAATGGGDRTPFDEGFDDSMDTAQGNAATAADADDDDGFDLSDYQ